MATTPPPAPNPVAPTQPTNQLPKAHLAEGRYFSRAFEKEALCYDQPCAFFAAVMMNKGATDLYMLVCDARDKSPVFPHLAPVKVPAGSTGSLDWSFAPRRMRDGIYIAASTAPDLKTLSATADCFFEVAYDLLYPA